MIAITVQILLVGRENPKISFNVFGERPLTLYKTTDYQTFSHNQVGLIELDSNLPVGTVFVTTQPWRSMSRMPR
jgi:hypothetical protein